MHSESQQRKNACQQLLNEKQELYQNLREQHKSIKDVAEEVERLEYQLSILTKSNDELKLEEEITCRKIGELKESINHPKKLTFCGTFTWMRLSQQQMQLSVIQEEQAYRASHTSPSPSLNAMRF